jgi:hypothetical protein
MRTLGTEAGMMKRAGWMGIVLAAVASVAAGGAGAQSWDPGLRADSAGLPADTVRLPVSFVSSDQCGVIDYRVVRDSAAVRRLRQWPQCATMDFGDVEGRTVVGVPLHGDCHARYGLGAFRSEERREYRVLVTTYYGGCRAARGEYRWIALPRLPAGWTIGFSERRVDSRGGGHPIELGEILGMVASGGFPAPPEPSRFLPFDSLAGLPADTVRLRSSVVELGKCEVGDHVVDNLGDVAELRGRTGCADTDFGDLSTRTLLGLSLIGDCAARFRVDLWRSEARREYLVRTIFRDGGCRAWGGGGYYWIALPKLPLGWRVRPVGGVTIRGSIGDAPGPGWDDGQPWIGRLHLPQPPTPAERP